MSFINPVSRAFYAQRYSAKQRGIRWYFTFDEWITWWETQLGPNWFFKRGRKRGQYVMSRNEDKGSYAWWNVTCKTCTANQQERPRNGASLAGIKHPTVKLTEDQVKDIFLGKGSFEELARKYNIHRDTVIYIKKGKLWGHLTTSFGSPYFDPHRRRPTGQHHNSENRKLTEALVREIFFANGSRCSLAKKYNVSRPTIKKIKQRTTWRHITSTL